MRALIYGLGLLGLLFAEPSSAQTEEEMAASWCKREPLAMDNASIDGGTVVIITGCTEHNVDLERHMVSPELAAAFDEWRNALWNEGAHILTRVNHYQLEVVNDSSRDMEIMLLSRDYRQDYLYSRYVSAAGSFSLHIPACQKIIVSFWAPGPTLLLSDVDVIEGHKHSHLKNRWTQGSVMGAIVPISKWTWYYPEPVKREVLTEANSPSHECSKVQ